MTNMNFGAGEFWYLYLNNVEELRIVVVFINYSYLAEIIKCLRFIIDKKKMVYRTFYVRWLCKNLLVYTFYRRLCSICSNFISELICNNQWSCTDFWMTCRCLCEVSEVWCQSLKQDLLKIHTLYMVINQISMCPSSAYNFYVME